MRIFQLGPGGAFDSPDYPAGDEVCCPHGDALPYLEQGPLTVYLPDDADAYEMQVGEAFFVPEGVRYQLINYTVTTAKAIFAIAPGL